MRSRALAIAVVVLMVSSIALFALSRIASAHPDAGPKTITVDGNPSDWTGVPGADNTGVESAGEFIWNDATGDDTGDGDYVYPTSGDFAVGVFDVEEVRITADATNLYVLITVGDLTNPWGGSDGFSTAAGVLLIDTTLNGVGQLTARPNVNIASGSGWEYYVKIGNVGWQVENSKVFDAAGNWAPTVNKGSDANNAVEVSVPLAFIGKDGYDVDASTWRFMLFWQSHAGENSDGFRTVNAAAQDYVFGGGTDSPYDPEIMDMGFSTIQATELSTYNPTTSTYATISSSVDVAFGAVGFVPDTAAPTLSAVAAAPTFNQVTITWTTNEIAGTAVDYGRFQPPALSRSIDEFVTGHSVTISGLRSASSYYYKIESMDIAGNVATSAVLSFTTAPAPPTNLASWVGGRFVWEDERGDDTGDGNFVYPNEPTVSWAGRGDIWFVNITQEGNWVHVSVRVNAAPETIWRQRMASFVLFIDVDRVPGSGATRIGFVQPESAPGHALNISVAPAFAWEYMVLATFQNLSEFTPGDNRGELLVRNSTFNTTLNTYGLVYMSTLPASTDPGYKPNAATVYSTLGGRQLDFRLSSTDLGLGTNMTYVGVGALYDDAGGGWPNGGIRQVFRQAQNWVGGGANGALNQPNVFDLAFYPGSSAQQTDLSQYGADYTTVTTAMQVDLATKWNARLTALGVSASLSDSSIGSGETSAVSVTLSEGGSPVAGASVSLAASPASAVDIITTNPTSTDTFGTGRFVVEANTVAADTTVTLTATATVEGLVLTSTLRLTVQAIEHTYGVFVAADATGLATYDETTVTVSFTDLGAPVSGASVALTSSNAALTIIASPATTNAQGEATFTVRAGYSETDVSVTLTATATNDTAQTVGTLAMTVAAFAHVYTLSGSASPVVVEENGTTTLTFVLRDAGNTRAGATVAIDPPASGFDIVGDASKTTGANGQVTFTLRARTVASDTSVAVTARASNGTAANVATETITVFAQAPAPAAPPVEAAGVSYAVFGGVAAALAVVGIVIGYFVGRSRKPKPPEKPPEERPGAP